MPMIKKLSLGALAIISIAAAITYFSYSSFRNERLGNLESGSRLIETAVGPIEYKVFGDSGPFLLYAHGRPGGYDQGFSIPGFRVLVPSRPGYLRTPLNVGRAPDEQAHAFGILLDSLDIGHVFVLGISGGGPSAISFAALYPQRTVALAVFAGVSQPMEPDEAEPPFMQSDFFLWITASTMRNSLVKSRLLNLLVRDPEARARIGSADSLLGDGGDHGRGKPQPNAALPPPPPPGLGFYEDSGDFRERGFDLALQAGHFGLDLVRGQA